MTDNLYNNLYAEGLISDESFEKISQREAKPVLFSLHWEIKTLLYIGVLMLTGGLGLLIYENIDTIGHEFVLMLIAAICLGCFYYCFNNKRPFSKDRVQSPNSYFDYILLLACTSLLIFVGYLQFEYKVFGTHYGMATFIPMLALFFAAYYFDHLGVLSMAIANLAVWMGVSVTPKQLLLNSDFNSETIIYTYLVLGIILIAAAYITQSTAFKKHFKFSYQHYGIHVAYIAMLAGYFHYYDSGIAAIWMLGIFALSYFMYKDAFKEKSFYFLLLVVLYSYIAVSSLFIRMCIGIRDVAGFYLIALYFMGTGVVLILQLINLNKKLKAA
ncbi:MAG: DUF2157 domain-containing protein [Bacteroidota bacterium]|nr:DUF2157 domain-containing protein [Bacteroidota bacterium]